MKPKKSTILLALALGVASPCQTFGADTPPVESADLYQPRTLDGVSIEAVETYLNPKGAELSTGVGWYPFNPYHNGLSLIGAFTVHFSRSFAWEIVNGSYIYSFQKGLTAELAERYGVEKRNIERLRYAFSTNAMFVHSNGKLIFLKDFVRYFRSSFVIGPGLLNTSSRNLFAANVGLRFEVFTSGSFSWKLDVRDTMAMPAFDHFVSFTLGMGLSF